MFNRTLRHITFTIARSIKRNNRYRRTLRELSALTDRDLADLGITRCDIPNVAWGAVTRKNINA